MRKRVKVIFTGAVVVALSGTGAAFALASPSGSPAVQSAAPAPTTTAPPVADTAEVATAPTTIAPAVPGVSSAAITAAQQKLNDLGYWVGDVDGKAGQTTQQAFYAFQKIQNLPRSGTLDSATAAALTTATRPAPASTSGDVIEIDKTRQVIFFVKGGQTQWVYNTSTGMEKSYVTNGNKGFAHTPTGTFKVNRVVNGVDPGPLGALYRPRYFTNNGIAIHGAAVIPATPASHGCARVSNAAMDYIWANNMMPMGASVWVYEDPAKQPFASTTTTAAPTTTSTTAAPTTTTTAAPTTTTSTTAAPATTSTTL